MATVLSVGDIAIVQYNSSTTDSFTFVFTRDVEAGTVVNFTDNGWLAAGGFRAGEGTLTYTAAAAVTAGTIVTLTGLNLDDAGDQIIAYQGDPATPTILHVVDLADGNNTVAGDATNDNTTALPPGFTLNLNAVAVGFDNALYAGPNSGSPAELSRAVSNSANWINSASLATLFKIVERPDIDLDADNSTTGGNSYRAFFTSGGPAVTIADSDIDISDLDGDAIFAAEIHIRGADFGDVLSVNGALPTGIAASLDPLTGVLTLSGEASHDAYEAAIRQIEFSTTQPIGTQKRIDVSVFDGEEWGPEAKAFITVGNTIESTPPVLDLDANDSNGVGADYTATFASGGPEIPVTDTDVSITDADSAAAIESATITLAINREPEDVLSFTGPAGPITAAYDSAAGILTLTGSATPAEYQTALRQVVFSTTSTSTADRIIEVTVNDGTFDSNVGTTLMHVVANVPPALNLDADSSTIGGVDYLTIFVDGGPAVAIVDTDVLITDSDDIELTSATVTLTNPDTDDVLVFNGTPPPGITASLYDPLTGILTLTGNASLAAYQTALRQITFDNTGTTPSTDSRIIDVVVNDGTAASNLAHAIIEVTQVNNTAPVVNLDADDSTVVGTSFRATFTEGGAPIPIADVDTLITDTDSTTLASATITLTDPQAGDLLAASGALPGGIMASSYDPVTGILTLSGVASLADYETALEAIRFSAAGENPVAGSRIVEVVVNDGANNSQAATALLTVVAVNDAPALVVADASYQENADPVLLSPSASLTDTDDTELNFAAVRITAGSFPGDGDTLTIGGATSGTVTGITFLWNPTLHALELTGASSPANYQALLQTVAFESTSDNPTDFDASPQRTLTWSVSDGAAATTATTTINIVAVNDAPQETVAATAAYTENGAPVTISPAATASDVDSSDLVFGLVRIAGGWVDGDVLTVNGLQSGTFAGIEFSYDADLHALVFSHPAPVADFQALMQAVQFGSTSENPTNFGANPTRTLGWGLHDGDDYSSPVQTTIVTITALNDAPINTVPGGQTVAEDTILPIVGVSVADIDSSALTTTLSVANGTLNVTAGPGVSGNDTANVTLTGTAAEINTALAGLAYAGNPDFKGGDTITVETTDGTATDTDIIAITVNAITAPWIFIASGDFNGDGTHDVLWQDPITGSTIEWLMSPNGGVGSIPPTPPAGGWDLVATGDFNADGLQDLMWKNASTGATSEWLMSPNGGIGSNPSTPATGGWDVIATGDFNGDGTTDIMWKTATGGITSEWLMSPNGGIGSNPTSIPATPGWDVIATGDFNGDGTTDIMWKTATGGITSEWLMSPDGGIGSNPTSIPATPGWDVIATGDFNGDGTTDIMWKTATGGITSEWLMSPNGGILSNPTSIPATPGWDVIATGVFNGDGTTDLLWKTASGGITSEWLMSPDGGMLSNATTTPATAGWDVIATGDFNGDGTTDVFWKTATDGLTSEWLMSPDGGLLTNPAGTPATGGYDVVATGVFNGDGTTDILWKTAPGLTSEWLMSAAGGLGSNPATPLAAGTPPLAGTVHDFPFV